MKKEKLEEIIKYQKRMISDLEDTIIKFDVELNKIYRENKQLHLLIDKAIAEIEYFDIKANHIDDNVYLDETLTNKLLEILKGGSNE